jgi:hypothetical protein
MPQLIDLTEEQLNIVTKINIFLEFFYLIFPTFIFQPLSSNVRGTLLSGNAEFDIFYHATCNAGLIGLSQSDQPMT